MKINNAHFFRVKQELFLLLFLSGFILFPACRQQPKTEVAPAESAYSEPHRPQFHFSPKEKWTNDPNGMFFYEGEYHLFYQHYPDSTVWGPMHWGHAVSKDLVHWEHLPIALYPDSLGYIFSGSAVVDWDNTSGFGKDGKPPIIAMYTYHDMVASEAGSDSFQSQAIAYSNDRGRTWTKYEGNPVIPNPGGVRDIRDPKVIWDEERSQWVVALAAGDHAEFWGSADLKSWKKLSEFGKDLGDRKGVWECPDLFPKKVEGTGEKVWVLILNLNPGNPNGGSGTQYFIGQFDGKNFTLDPAFLPYVQNGQGVWLDKGKDNYAGVTWSDVPEADGRRLFMGWMSNWEYANLVPTQTWRNAMTIPWSLEVKKTAQGYRIFSHPVKELEVLCQNAHELDQQMISSSVELTDQLGFSPTLSELDLTFLMTEDSTGSFGVELSNDQGESYRIGYDARKKVFFSDRTKAGDASFSKDFAAAPTTGKRISNDQTIHMHIFFDVASAEMFADHGETVMTEIFFPGKEFNRMKLFSDGGKVELKDGKIYELKGIWNK